MLSQRLQIKAVAERLVGIKSSFRPDDFAEPWRTIYAAVDSASPGSEVLALVTALYRRPNWHELFRSVTEFKLDGGSDALVKSLAEHAPDLTPIEWLWPGWIPLGMLSLLGARPGKFPEERPKRIAKCMTMETPSSGLRVGDWTRVTESGTLRGITGHYEQRRAPSRVLTKRRSKNLRAKVKGRRQLIEEWCYFAAGYAGPGWVGGTGCPGTPAVGGPAFVGFDPRGRGAFAVQKNRR